MLELLRISRVRRNRCTAFAAVVVASALLTGCPITLVQPYDDKLFNDTEAFYKKAAGMIDEGVEASPLTDADRKAIKEPAKSPAHLSKFAPKYDSLLSDADLLLMRGIAGSGKLDATGERINRKVEELIGKSIELPKVCDDLQQQFKAAPSLTVKNYVDLKCLVLGWRAQHADAALTENTQILKKGNWEGRRLAMFSAVLAIQKAESFKKDK